MWAAQTSPVREEGAGGWDFKPILAALLAYSVAFISKIKAHQNTKEGKERNIQIIKFKSLKNLLGVWVQIQRVPSHDMARDQSPVPCAAGTSAAVCTGVLLGTLALELQTRVGQTVGRKEPLPRGADVAAGTTSTSS